MAKWLTAHAVAEMLSVSYDGALRIMKRAGAKKLGALVRIREDVLQAYLDQCPDLVEEPTSISDQDKKPGTHTSTATGGTSASKQKTTNKHSSTSPTSYSVTQLRDLRRKRAS